MILIAINEFVSIILVCTTSLLYSSMSKKSKVSFDCSGARSTGRYSLSVSLSVSQLKIWRTALTIFLIFCMNVPYYKTKKRTGPFVRENSGSFNNHENVPKTALF